MFNWDWIQSKAAGKNILSYAAGLATMAAAWGLISAHDATVLQEGVSDIYNGLVMAGKGFVAVAGVLIPIYTAWKAAHNASQASRITSVAEIAKDPTQPAAPEAKVALLTAASSMPEIKQDQPAIVLDKSVPGATAMAAKLPENVVAR